MRTTLDAHFSKREKEIEKETLNAVLIDALKNNDFEKVKESIKHGASASSIINTNYPIEIAAAHCDKKMIEFLVDKGADVSVNDNITFKLAGLRGKTDTLEYLLEQAPGTDLNDSYRMACGRGNKETMNYIESQQANLNYSQAIQTAASQGQVETCSYLNAKLESKGIEYDKSDCLKYALLKGQKETMDYFIDLGADTNKALESAVKSISKPKEMDAFKSNVQHLIFDKKVKISQSTIETLNKYGCQEIEQMQKKKELNESLVFRLDAPRPKRTLSSAPSMRMKI